MTPWLCLLAIPVILFGATALFMWLGNLATVNEWWATPLLIASGVPVAGSAVVVVVLLFAKALMEFSK